MNICHEAITNRKLTMKPSNLQAPRTQADAILLPSYDPIERLKPTGYSVAWWVCVVVLAVASTVVIVATR